MNLSAFNLTAIPGATEDRLRDEILAFTTVVEGEVFFSEALVQGLLKEKALLALAEGDTKGMLALADIGTYLFNIRDARLSED